MFTIYYSNRLERHIEHLAAVLSQPLRAPLAPETVIVQSNGMARWLSLQLADHLGVCANIRFPFPATLLWETFRAVLPEVPDTSLFEAPVLTWRLMGLLQELEPDERFAPLHHYLHTGDDFRCYELAQRVAEVFNQYLIYRPDWIQRWEDGHDAHWQAELWRRLAAGGGEHRALAQARFLQTLPATAPEQLPERLALFGISTLAPAYLEIFARLGEKLDVHLFMLNPCQEYWGDIRAERDIARLGADVDAEAEYLEVGNVLLASLGRQGRDFIDLLQHYPSGAIENYTDPGEDTLLHCLQSDMLNLRQRGDDAFPATPLPIADRSLQIHACHSPMREVEVLHDQLLALFEADPALQPSDVLVMTPEIETYGPLIDAVFATAPAERYIPFSIADRDLRSESALIDAFFSLLDLPGSRFDANQVLALLEVAAIQRRFDLSESDLPLIQRWVRATGIRWGIDAANRAALELPATAEHTWQTGLDRLLLGYALPGDNRRLHESILPYDEIEGEDAQIAGRLAAFADAVFALATELAGSLPLAGWAGALNNVLAQFFEPTESEENDAQWLRATLDAIAMHGGLTDFREPVSLEVIKGCLRRYLTLPEGRTGRFLSGGVTFCAMVPMRSIPFKVVCLLGMNNDSYPRPQQRLGFDLMIKYRRRCDRSRRNDDRYLFLEALLSARHCFYISYVGNDIYDNSIRPPSVLVSELTDAIARGFFVEAGTVLDQIVTRHPLQAFSPRYFSGDPRLFSYSAQHAEASALAGRGQREPTPFFIENLPEPEAEWRTLDLPALCYFFAHPTRYLLRRRLGITLDEGEGRLETREPFTLDPLAEQQLDAAMLTLHRDGASAAEALTVLQASGALPHGQIGESVFARQQEKVERFAGRLARALPKRTLEPLEVDLALGDWRLTGWLTEVAETGLVGYRLAAVRARDWLDLWIRHLVLHLTAPPAVQRQSHWLGRDREVLLGPVERPAEHLQHLLACYWRGLVRPLPFFPKSSFAYAEALGNPKRTPLDAARAKWEGGDFSRGESEDLYYRVAFKGTDPLAEEFMQLAEEIFGPIFAHVVDGDQ